jgi:hypothetical protein
MIVGINHRVLTQAMAGFRRPSAFFQPTAIPAAFAGDRNLAIDQTRQ